MLPCIANQKHAVGWVKAMKKLVHLLRTCKARFIDNKEPFLSISGCFVPNEMAGETRIPRRFAPRNDRRMGLCGASVRPDG